MSPSGPPSANKLLLVGTYVLPHLPHGFQPWAGYLGGFRIYRRTHLRYQDHPWSCPYPQTAFSLGTGTESLVFSPQHPAQGQLQAGTLLLILELKVGACDSGSVL